MDNFRNVSNLWCAEILERKNLAYATGTNTQDKVLTDQKIPCVQGTHRSEISVCTEQKIMRMRTYAVRTLISFAESLFVLSLIYSSFLLRLLRVVKVT